MTTNTTTRTLTEAAIVAAAVRKELRAAFPGTKFSVTSQNFAGGDSVRASWADGPTAIDLAAIYSGSTMDTENMIYRALRKADLLRPYAGLSFVDGELVVKTSEEATAAA